ncbi:MAG TPA: CBS domain-containing protein, partial [Gemmatimonadales bacterium]|nr:CBS domain-containing protein [Gemmatimonadales bacterium]
MRKLLDRMVELVRRGELALFTRRAHEFEPADLAEVLTALDEKERVSVVQALPPELSSQALAEMPEEAHAEETLAALDPDLAAEIVDELDDDDAADILGELDPKRQEQILSAVEDRTEVDQLLRYDEETAGGLMTTHMVTVTDTSTAEQALEEIRRQAEEVEDFYQVFVVDMENHLVGTLPFKDLVISRPERPVRAFMTDADIFVTPDLDQEEVARLMARY